MICYAWQFLGPDIGVVIVGDTVDLLCVAISGDGYRCGHRNLGSIKKKIKRNILTSFVDSANYLTVA